MWEVVKREKGKEKVVSESPSYAEAFAEYSTLAEKFNATDEDGNYLHPEVRISLRQTGTEAIAS